MDMSMRKYLTLELSALTGLGPRDTLNFVAHRLDEHGVQTLGNRKAMGNSTKWIWHMPQNGDGTDGSQEFDTQDQAWADAALKLVRIENDLHPDTNADGYYFFTAKAGGLRIEWADATASPAPAPALVFTVAWTALAGRSKIGLVHALKDALKDHGVTFDNAARTWSVAGQTYGPFEAIWAMMLDVSRHVRVVGSDGIERPMGIGPDGNMALPAECDPVPLAGTVKQEPLFTEDEQAETCNVYSAYHAVRLSRQLDELLGTEYRPGDELHQAGRLIRKMVKGASKTRPTLECTANLDFGSNLLTLEKVAQALTSIMAYNAADERIDNYDLQVAQMSMEMIKESMHASIDMLVDDGSANIDDISVRRMIRHMATNGTKAGELCAAMLATLQRERLAQRQPAPAYTPRQITAIQALVESFDKP